MLPPISSTTRALIIANVAVFMAQSVSGEELIYHLALWPIGSGKMLGGYFGFQPWQVVTYAFLHTGLTHLLFNMFALYMFGSDLERLWGTRRFINLYFASVVAAALVQLGFAAVTGADPYPTAGASGGVFGVLLGFAMVFSKRRILLLIPPIPMPAWVFVTLYGVVELVLGMTGSDAGVAHFAHLGGMLGAWLMLRYWQGRAPFSR